MYHGSLGKQQVFRGKRKETHTSTTTSLSIFIFVGLTHTLTDAGPLTMMGLWKIKARLRDHFIHSAVLNKDGLSQKKDRQKCVFTF